MLPRRTRGSRRVILVDSCFGIGAGHREAVGAAYVKPYQAVVDYLDSLDAADVPNDAREILGAGVLLTPEQKVVVQRDANKARAIGRPAVEKPYLHLRSYTNNLRGFGFDEADLADGGSDRLIDALVARGDARMITERLNEHLDAGADHVAIQLLTAEGDDPIPGYEALAEELFG